MSSLPKPATSVICCQPAAIITKSHFSSAAVKQNQVLSAGSIEIKLSQSVTLSESGNAFLEVQAINKADYPEEITPVVGGTELINQSILVKPGETSKTITFSVPGDVKQTAIGFKPLYAPTQLLQETKVIKIIPAAKPSGLSLQQLIGTGFALLAAIGLFLFIRSRPKARQVCGS